MLVVGCFGVTLGGRGPDTPAPFPFAERPCATCAKAVTRASTGNARLRFPVVSRICLRLVRDLKRVRARADEARRVNYHYMADAMRMLEWDLHQRLMDEMRIRRNGPRSRAKRASPGRSA